MTSQEPPGWCAASFLLRPAAAQEVAVRAALQALAGVTVAGAVGDQLVLLTEEPVDRRSFEARLAQLLAIPGVENVSPVALLVDEERSA